MKHLFRSFMFLAALGIGMPPIADGPPLPPRIATAATIGGEAQAGDDARIRPTEPPAEATRALASQVTPGPVLVLTDATSVRAAVGSLRALSDGPSPAGLCLPVEALADADAALEQDVAGRLRPALARYETPVCLVVRPVGPIVPADSADSTGLASPLSTAIARARGVLGPDVLISEVRLDVSGHALSVAQAAAQTALVGRAAHGIVPEARLTVVLGGFADVDATRASGAGAYLGALDRWQTAQQASLAGSGAGVASIDLSLDDLAPRTVALGQDWLRTRGIAAGVQVAGDTGVVERIVRPLLLAGGSAEVLAIVLSRPSASEPVARGTDVVDTDVVDTDMIGALSASLADLRPGGLLPRIELRDASVLALPGPGRDDDKDVTAGSHPADSNSPAYWDDDALTVFTSVAQPRRSAGKSLFELGPARPVRVRGDEEADRPMRWLEAVYKADNGRLYGWYHEEPEDVCPKRTNRSDVALTVPRVGAMRSDDAGQVWRDLGIVLESPARALRCDTANHFFAGGVGDFSVIPDRSGADLYFIFSSFGPALDQQGIGLARISRRDLDAPVGAVWRWGDAGWTEPGIGGRGTMVYPAATDWHRPDANTFWGPAVHWNAYLNRYVLLLNRARDANWSHDGAYVAFADNLAQPLGWTVPQKLRDGGDWYAQAIGTDAGRRETDTFIGRNARYFEHGVSRHELIFHRPGE